MSPYPWLARQWSELSRALTLNRLGHALLLSGREATGLEQFATRFAASALCEAAADVDKPCGDCRSCLLFAGGTHPDFKLIAPAEEGKSIRIEQIRAVTDYYSLKPHYERGKIVVIAPADAMNSSAANALLKILEEPPAAAMLILVAHRFQALSMTIRSRCMRVSCEQFDRSAARSWLSDELEHESAESIDSLLTECGGAPLAARELATHDNAGLDRKLLDSIAQLATGNAHALDLAQSFGGISMTRLSQMMNVAVSRLIFAKFGRNSYYDRAHRAPDPSLQALADHLDLKDLYAFLDLLFETKTLIATHTGFRDADTADSLWLGLAKAVQVRS